MHIAYFSSTCVMHACDAAASSCDFPSASFQLYISDFSLRNYCEINTHRRHGLEPSFAFRTAFNLLIKIQQGSGKKNLSIHDDYMWMTQIFPKDSVGPD